MIFYILCALTGIFFALTVFLYFYLEIPKLIKEVFVYKVLSSRAVKKNTPKSSKVEKQTLEEVGRIYRESSDTSYLDTPFDDEETEEPIASISTVEEKTTTFDLVPNKGSSQLLKKEISTPTQVVENVDQERGESELTTHLDVGEDSDTEYLNINVDEKTTCLEEDSEDKTALLDDTEENKTQLLNYGCVEVKTSLLDLGKANPEEDTQRLFRL